MSITWLEQEHIELTEVYSEEFNNIVDYLFDHPEEVMARMLNNLGEDNV